MVHYEWQNLSHRPIISSLRWRGRDHVMRCLYSSLFHITTPRALALFHPRRCACTGCLWMHDALRYISYGMQKFKFKNTPTRNAHFARSQDETSRGGRRPTTRLIKIFRLLRCKNERNLENLHMEQHHHQQLVAKKPVKINAHQFF